MLTQSITESAESQRVWLNAGGFQASIPGEQAGRILPQEEKLLGAAIQETKKRFARELTIEPMTWQRAYNRLADTSGQRVRRVILDGGTLPDSMVEHLDRTLLAIDEARPGSEHALDWLIESHQIVPEFLVALYSQHRGAFPELDKSFRRWREAVNTLVEQFYQAAIKSYWDAVRSGDRDPDDVASDALSLLIRCAERYSPEKGDFSAYFATYAKYNQLNRVQARRDEDFTRVAMPEENGRIDALLSEADYQNTQTPEQQILEDDLIDQVKSLVEELPEQERLIIAHYFEMGRYCEVQRELARQMNLTPGRISQIKSVALKKLKRRLEKCSI